MKLSDNQKTLMMLAYVSIIGIIFCVIGGIYVCIVGGISFSFSVWAAFNYKL